MTRGKTPWQRTAAGRQCARQGTNPTGPRGKPMRGRELLARLREEVLLGDGALGTMLSERGVGRETNYECLNLTHPEVIQELHGAYVDAGARLIETNTFGANRTKLALGPGRVAQDLGARDVSDVN